MVTPLKPKSTRRAEALGRVPPTIGSSVHPFFFFVRTFAYGRKKIYLVLYYVGLRLLVYLLCRHPLISKLEVYYESIKREPKIRGIKKCRCDERLQTKTKEFTRLPYTGLVWELKKKKKEEKKNPK
jgi:hypothetical protein